MRLNWLYRPLPLTTQVLRLIPVFLACVILLAVALIITNGRMPDPKIVRPLPDIGFEIFPKVGWLEKLTDACIALLNVLSVVILFKLYLLHRKDAGMEDLHLPFKVPFVSRFVFGVWSSGIVDKMPYRDVHLIACVRFLASYSIMLIFRALVIIMTSYPATDNHCQNPVPITNPLKNIFLTVVTLGSGSIHCGDLMFSGHTIIITLNLMIQWTYGPLIHWLFRPVACIIVPFSFYCIIASRSHYTDDILVAFYATITTFLAIPHRPKGVPWQMNILIGWWPCCGANALPQDLDDQRIVIVTEEPILEERHGNGKVSTDVIGETLTTPIMTTSVEIEGEKRAENKEGTTPREQ
ncbi:putative phosphatidylcholine:ceramide cholinephosphotransferase 2 [Trypanosoma theileri]|uniref:Putative phosphatidylcholine:ceramide cholinephosphotransferase 2 n=1 Tax=Trypanosoma theileri TaxID=67003 RepID=A0A1X0P4U9_9TRYP|nr:putative phosphatidylcholine:ceramide cholinephosphotransferase 2 [Trypanosoma theileri]ORC91952.1 putative phosphatidylcholine:ceramide cholinephosphotransferase 2 [Trypanosoma theileri]